MLLIKYKMKVLAPLVLKLITLSETEAKIFGRIDASYRLMGFACCVICVEMTLYWNLGLFIFLNST